MKKIVVFLTVMSMFLAGVASTMAEYRGSGAGAGAEAERGAGVGAGVGADIEPGAEPSVEASDIPKEPAGQEAATAFSMKKVVLGILAVGAIAAALGGGGGGGGTPAAAPTHP